MLLVQGRSTPGALAKRFGTTKSSMQRHAANHLPKYLATFATRVNALEADQILGQVLALYERGLQALSEAEAFTHDADKAKAIPALLRESRANLEAMTKVSVMLSQGEANEPVHVSSEVGKLIEEALRRRRPSHGEGWQEGASGLTPQPALSAPNTEDATVYEAEVVETDQV